MGQIDKIHSHMKCRSISHENDKLQKPPRRLLTIVVLLVFFLVKLSGPPQLAMFQSGFDMWCKTMLSAGINQEYSHCVFRGLMSSQKMFPFHVGLSPLSRFGTAVGIAETSSSSVLQLPLCMDSWYCTATWPTNFCILLLVRQATTSFDPLCVKKES